MAAPLDVLYRQRVLACSGFYTASLDGKWGPKSEAADKAFYAEYQKIQKKLGTFDPRTEGAIITLLPKAQIKAREFMNVAGKDCKLLSGTRTYAEQDALYRKRPVV